MSEYLYIVTRTWSPDFDQCSTTWYVLFISKDYEKALKYYKSDSDFKLEGDGKLYLCKIPIDKELDVIQWEQYII
jgi:hypothetical protein